MHISPLAKPIHITIRLRQPVLVAALGGQSEVEGQASNRDHKAVIGIVASETIRAYLTSRGGSLADTHCAQLPSENPAAMREVRFRYYTRDQLQCASDVAIARRIDGQILVAARDLALFDDLPRLGAEDIDGPAHTIQHGCSRFIGSVEVSPQRLIPLGPV